jgi:uncharacterized UBP type Zn finger protein
MTAPASWIAVDEDGQPICTHLGDTITVPDPPAAECLDCVAEGTTWFHLRQCLMCGEVRCCDNSPRRHATAHFRATGHPLVRSAQPDETWAWCYADERFLRPAKA